jgi:hypothetical protein
MPPGITRWAGSDESSHAERRRECQPPQPRAEKQHEKHPHWHEERDVDQELQPVVVDGQQLAMPVQRIENPVVEGAA